MTSKTQRWRDSVLRSQAKALAASLLHYIGIKLDFSPQSLKKLDAARSAGLKSVIPELSIALYYGEVLIRNVGSKAMWRETASGKLFIDFFDGEITLAINPGKCEKNLQITFVKDIFHLDTLYLKKHHKYLPVSAKVNKFLMPIMAAWQKK